MVKYATNRKGKSIPYRYRSDGEILLGYRKFTQKELRIYTENMYGKHCRNRWARMKRNISPETREILRENGRRCAQLTRELYGDDFWKHRSPAQKAWTEKLHETYAKSKENRERARQMGKKSWRKAVAANKERGFVFEPVHYPWYVLYPMKVNGKQYEKWDEVYTSNPDFELINEMCIAFQAKELPKKEYRFLRNTKSYYTRAKQRFLMLVAIILLSKNPL